MITIQNVFDALCLIAPLELQMAFDNAGFQLGHADSEVRCVLLALDVTDAVIEEAGELGAQLIVTHHPLIFSPLQALTDSNPTQRRILRLAEKNIGLISMHTNLDVAQGGVNDVLIRLLGAEPESSLDNDGCGRIGTLPIPMELALFLDSCKKSLQVPVLRYADGGKWVSKLAVMGGAGAESMEFAVSLGCDTYVTSDVKYHQFQHAADLGLNLIDADHFFTENPIIANLAQRLSEKFPDISFHISERHTDCIRFA